MAKTDNQLITQLIDFGLSDKGAAVYVATLELGHGTVSQISRKAGINRTTGYDILSSLTSEGLVEISGKEPKQEYVAESPDNLLKLLDKKTESLNKKILELEAKTQKAKAFVPLLKTIQKVGDRSTVKFYEGVEGLKQVYEDTLTSHEKIRAFATVEYMHDTLGNYFPAYYKRRAGKGIAIKTILPNTPLSAERATHDKEEARESTLVPADRFTFSPEINIYDNKTMIASWREKLGIIIESAEIADAMKKIFELAWIGAKQVEKEAGLAQ